MHIGGSATENETMLIKKDENIKGFVFLLSLSEGAITLDRNALRPSALGFLNLS